MAEGDTVHRWARRIASALGDRPLVQTAAPNARSPLRRQPARLEALRGRRLERADARGKHLLLRFEGDLALHCHHGMHGSWLVRGPGERRRRAGGGAWVVLATEDAEIAELGGPRLALRTGGELALDRWLRALGPDLLGAGFTVEDGVRALRGRAGAERRLGDALLDQTVLAGAGNVYKAEGCFAARVSPWRRLGELDDEALRRVVVETAGLMRAGLETGRRPHDVYRRAGRPCPRCGEPIRSRGQGDANRITYWCPGCQE